MARNLQEIPAIKEGLEEYAEILRERTESALKEEISESGEIWAAIAKFYDFDSKYLEVEKLREVLKSSDRTFANAIFKQFFHENPSKALTYINEFAEIGLDASIQEDIVLVMEKKSMPYYTEKILGSFERIENGKLAQWIMNKGQPSLSCLMQHRSKLPPISETRLIQAIERLTKWGPIMDWGVVIAHREDFPSIPNETLIREILHQKGTDSFIALWEHRDKVGLSEEGLIDVCFELSLKGVSLRETILANLDLLSPIHHQKIVDRLFKSGNHRLVLAYSKKFKEIDIEGAWEKIWPEENAGGLH